MAQSQAIYTACHSGLVKYLTRAVGHPETARDLAHDVFVRVAESPTLPDTDAGQRAWVFRIARNIAIDHHRRQRFRQAGPIAVEPITGSADSADTTLIVNQAIASLDDMARDVFLMREVAGLSYTEIAEACGLTPDSVRSRIHRARLELREHLQKPIAVTRTRQMRAGFAR